MAGINNAEFCRKQRAGLVILGGFNADRASMDAARKVVERGRREFIFDDPIEGIEREVREIRGRMFAVNVRSAELEGYLEVAELVDDYDGILEINAHCRQPELVSAKCGEWLLYNHDVLLDIVAKASKIAPVFVKIRGGHKLDYMKLGEKLFRAGCTAIHVDAMIPGGGCNFNLISSLSKLGSVIGNNSFVDIPSGERILKCGAKMVSAARAVLRDSMFFEKMLSSPMLSQPVEL